MKSPFQLSTLPVTRWKNGAGETREIISIPSPDADFLWRASIATIKGDGPFSLFAGVDRVITLLDGAPLWLRGSDVSHHLQPWQPWSFAGEWPLASEGVLSEGMDFNIMTQRSRASAQVRTVSTAQPPANEGIAYVLKGTWQLAGRDYAAGEGVWWQSEQPGEWVPQSDDATLLLAEITRCER